MAYRYGVRNQMMVFPPSREEYVAKDDPVHAYDILVESLDFVEHGIVCDPDKGGNPEYDPRAMLKVLVYGYSYGMRSSRE